LGLLLQAGTFGDVVVAVNQQMQALPEECLAVESFGGADTGCAAGRDPPLLK
jgi:hypothetical protein